MPRDILDRPGSSMLRASHFYHPSRLGQTCVSVISLPEIAASFRPESTG